MFYCPKCQQTYDEGAQRFCSNDGGRLLPAPSTGKSVNQSGGVFTNLLGTAVPRTENDEQIAAVPKFVRIETAQSARPGGQPPVAKNTFENIIGFDHSAEPKPQTQKPLPRIIKQDEVPSGQARLGDRKTNPTGRLALTVENPKILIGQTVKGRYQITDLFARDETLLSYTAGDKLAAGKKVVVQVLTDEDESDRFTNKIFAEERVSLSLINHPNIARILDSGELLEGKPFIVSEYADGESVAALLRKTKQINASRTVRIVNQIADALNSAHQNGVLHRSLSPDNIILTISEVGNEQVKLINFGISKKKLKQENIVYQSPEQLQGKLANYASDIYALAVITFQMLTGRLPFNGATANDLIDAQNAGLSLHLTNLRMDLPVAVDLVLDRGLAFKPSDRYPKARDFGEALSNSLKTEAVFEIENTDEELDIAANEIAEYKIPMPPLSPAKPEFKVPEPEKPNSTSFSFAPDNLLETANGNAAREVKAEENSQLAWEKRSPDQKKTLNWSFAALPILGILLLAAAVWGGWAYLLNTPPESQMAVETPKESVFPTESQNIGNSAPATPLTEDIEIPPPPRTVPQPPNTVYFQNSKDEMKGDLAKNFLGFSLYYPKDWKQNAAAGKFIDISKTAPTGSPIEQFLVSYYDSKGTFKDDAELFPVLVKETNTTVSKIIPNYEMVSEGKKTVNNGWQAYEVTFKGGGKTAKGEDILIWGRRLFIPTSRPGMKNGYVITMLASSLSPDVKGVEDVGVKGELSSVLESFEPNQSF